MVNKRAPRRKSTNRYPVSQALYRRMSGLRGGFGVELADAVHADVMGEFGLGASRGRVGVR